MRLAVAWRNLLARPVQNGLTLTVVTLSVAMVIIVTLLAGGIQGGLVKATEPFDIIVGAKGSPNQLVLNTVFLQDTPIGNIKTSMYEKVAANSNVSRAIPLAFGDNYKGYRLVGTDSSIFTYQIRPADPAWLQFAAGKAFAKPFEAVVGAKVAQDLGLKLGDEFTSSHGLVSSGESHKQVYKVTGILKGVSGPYDNAILVSIDSIWQAHEYGHAEDHEEHGEDKAITAILVKPKGYSEAMRLYQQFQKDQAVQVIFPAQVIIELFAILGQSEEVLASVAYTVMSLGLILISLSVYWSALGRARERAILRAIGASAGDIFTIIFAEGAFLVLSGVAAGIAAGHGVYIMAANRITQKTAVVFNATLIPAEGYIALGAIAAGMAAGLIPAFLTYRTDIAGSL